MNPTEYQIAAHRFATYPHSDAMEYLALGLAEEVGEVCGKLKRLKRGEQVLDSAIILELGDVCWYVSEICRHMGFDWGRIVAIEDAKTGGCRPLPIWVLYMDEAAATISAAMVTASVSEKPVYIGAMSSGIQETTGAIIGFCDAMGVTIDQVLDANIEKLQGRMAAGTICGSGDSR